MFSNVSLQPCIIADCGEHKEGDSWGFAPKDGSGDSHPDFPEDSDIDFKDVSEIFDHQGHRQSSADSIRRSQQVSISMFSHLSPDSELGAGHNQSKSWP